MEPENRETLLRIEQVHAYYGLSHVLQGICLDVTAGQVTAVVGRNGVGKTTLINTLMGLVPASAGQMLLGGADLAKLPPTRRRGLGMALVPQGRRVFRSLTVDEHLQLVTIPAGSPYTRDRLYEIFPRLHERRRSLAKNLSGGEQSMLAIARALTTNPRLLLMDEPTEGLAPLLVERVREIIERVREQGLTVLLVEQNLQFALACADRVAVMQRGAVAQVFEPGAVPDRAALSDLIMGHDQ